MGSKRSKRPIVWPDYFDDTDDGKKTLVVNESGRNGIYSLTLSALDELGNESAESECIVERKIQTLQTPQPSTTTPSDNTNSIFWS